MHFNAEGPKNLPIGFLFEVTNARNEVKGYFYGSPHLADKEMSGALQNVKIQDVFKKSVKVQFENIKRYLNDISSTTGLSRAELRACGKLSAVLLEIEASPQTFFSCETFGEAPLDEELGITRPGMDFHLLGEAYAQGKPVASLEDKKASWQETAREEDIPKFLEKLQNFFENDPQLIQLFLEGTKGEKSREVDAEETKQLVQELQQAWKEGNSDKFVEISNKLPGNFLENLKKFNALFLNGKTLKDYSPEETKSLLDIAFQRSRELDLAKKVHDILVSETDAGPQFFVFGNNHLVSQDNINLVSLLAAKGWQIKQII